MRSGLRRKKPPSAADTSARAVFLVGFMGAGKSSVGRTLGQQLRWTFEDLDDRIERNEERTVAEIFRTSGEREFRRAERTALRQVLAELNGGAARVVALGGGAFVPTGNAALLRKAGVPTVFLDADVEELWRRCQNQASERGVERPLLGSLERFGELYKSRRRNYLKASLRVKTGSLSVESIAQDIARTLGLRS